MPKNGAHLPLFRSLLLKYLLFSVGFVTIWSDIEASLCYLRQLFIEGFLYVWLVYSDISCWAKNAYLHGEPAR